MAPDVQMGPARHGRAFHVAVTMRAEMDLIVVVSACPRDITVINGLDRRPSDIHVTIASPAP